MTSVLEGDPRSVFAAALLGMTALVGCNTHPTTGVATPPSSDHAATAPPRPPHEGAGSASAASGVEGATPVAAVTPAWATACREAIAPRFHPPASWSHPSNVGPKDRAPYRDCKAWIDGTPHPDNPLPASGCGDARGGWAGISTAKSLLANALSDDGSTLMRCDGACVFSRVDNGRVLGRTGPQEADGVPVRDKPAVKKLAKKLGFSGQKAAWPGGDTFVDWSLSPEGSVITYYLRDRKSAAEIPIGRFSEKSAYLFPTDASWSANGRSLLLTVWLFPEGQGVELRDAVVDLPAALALLDLRAVEIASDDNLRGRAETACAALGERDAGALRPLSREQHAQTPH